jgi:hypothetical protein
VLDDFHEGDRVESLAIELLSERLIEVELPQRHRGNGGRVEVATYDCVAGTG